MPQQREEAFNIRDYPCIGQFRFLVLVLYHLPIYPSILERMKHHGATFLDVGLALGQDLRRLVADGAPSENTYGIDIDRHLMNLGYQMFNDRDKLKTTFIAGDIFDEGKIPGWNESLKGKMDILHASAFFTLFDDWEKQRDAACVLVRLGRPKKGTLILGRQAGAIEPQVSRGIWEGSTTFFHNVQSWRKFWDEVGELTGSTWKTDAWIDEVAVQGLGRGQDQEKQPYYFDKKRRLMFMVERQG